MFTCIVCAWHHHHSIFIQHTSPQHNYCHVEFKGASGILYTACDLVELGLSDFFTGIPVSET